MVLQTVKRLADRAPRLTGSPGASYRSFSGSFPGPQHEWLRRYKEGRNSGSGWHSESFLFHKV